jgi:hypothetical protein
VFGLIIVRIDLCVSELTGNDISLFLTVQAKDKKGPSDDKRGEVVSYIFHWNVQEVFLPKEYDLTDAHVCR